jgi:hypothetical protein
MTPLPGGWADELLWHMRNCPECVSAKALRMTTRCPRGLELVQKTLNERHGEDLGGTAR